MPDLITDAKDERLTKAFEEFDAKEGDVKPAPKWLLRDSLRASLQELHTIDEVLARRPALEEQNNRVDKILHAIVVAKNCDAALSRVAGLECQKKALQQVNEVAEAQLCAAREAAFGFPINMSLVLSGKIIRIREALSSTGPCAHEAEARMRRIANDNLRAELIEKEAELKRLREALTETREHIEWAIANTLRRRAKEGEVKG